MITIGVVTFNRPELLKECISSILAQKYQDWHLIISNDYVLKDVTFADLEINPDQRITIVNQKKNIGEIANLNFLLNLCKTKFFTWLCDDDQFHDQFLAKAVDAFNYFGANNLVAFYSNYQTGLTYDVYKTIEPDSYLLSPQIFRQKQFIDRYLLKRLPLIGCYGVMCTEVLKGIGGFKVLGNSFSPYADTLLPISLSEHGQVAYSGAPLVFLRTHESSLSFTSPDFLGYTTAEGDFVRELTLIHERSPASINLERCLGLSCLWFSDNHFAVLMRGRCGSTLDVYLKYFKHEISVSLPRLNFYWKLRLLLHITHFCLNNAIYSISRKISTFFTKHFK